MFGRSLSKGFDIVIGNPPYVDSETMTRIDPELRKRYCEVYASAKGNWDLFVVFIERGMQLLTSGGAISYIVPNKLVGARYTQALRTILLKNDIRELRDFSKVDVFKEADVYPMVFLVRKAAPDGTVIMTSMSSLDDIDRQNEIAPTVFYKDIEWAKYFASNDVVGLVSRISLFPQLSTQWRNISGAATVSEAYELTKHVKEFDSLVPSKYHKMVNTGTIDRYTILWGRSKMTYIKSSYLRPIVSDADLMSVSQQRLKQASSNKIIIAGMVKELECAYDTGEFLAGKSTTIIVEDAQDTLPLKVALALLNSSLISFWYKHSYSSSVMAGGYISIKHKEIGRIPVAEVSKSDCSSIVNLVDEILSLTNSDDYLQSQPKQSTVTQRQKEIDQLIYKLYGLTQQEIRLVEQP